MRARAFLFVVLALGFGFLAGRVLRVAPGAAPGIETTPTPTSTPTPALTPAPTTTTTPAEPLSSAVPSSPPPSSPVPPSTPPSSPLPSSPLPPGVLPVVRTAGSPIPGALTPEETRDIEVFRRAAPSVVHITSVELARDMFFDVMRMRQGTGSGIVWDRRGHIVTNFHVVQGADRFEVRLADQSSYRARVVGVAPEKDLAVLVVEAPAAKLVPLELGRSQDLLVGQRTLAVGNPFGLDQTLTIGVVSALGRELQAPNGRTIHDVIQTDAAINPGNSGGPLLDSTGRLIGVNSAIYSPSGTSAGIGFAIPVDTVKRLAAQLIAHGRSIQPTIGIRALPDSYAERLGLEGVVIQEVERGSPADRAGLEGLQVDRWGSIRDVGDRIVGVNGRPVSSVDDLLAAFESAGVGSTVKLSVARGRGEREVKVPLTGR